MSGFGMMEGAYFKGRYELLNWLNDLLQTDYEKIEQCSTGAEYCQIIDAVHPGTVPLQKVNFSARQEADIAKNFKVLQDAFEKNGIEKRVDVERLMKGRYQDNLEFLQWIKRYFDVHSPSETYDAKARREAAIAASKSNQRNVQNRAPIVPKVAQLATSKPRATAATARVGGGAENGAISTLRSAARVTTTLAPTSAVANATTTTTSAARRGSPSSATTARLERQVNELKNDIADLQATVDALEKERNIYFNKLRGVEVLCQEMEAQHPDIIKQILDRLYSDEPSNIQL